MNWKVISVWPCSQQGLHSSVVRVSKCHLKCHGFHFCGSDSEIIFLNIWPFVDTLILIHISFSFTELPDLESWEYLVDCIENSLVPDKAARCLTRTSCGGMWPPFRGDLLPSWESVICFYLVLNVAICVIRQSEINLSLAVDKWLLVEELVTKL